MSAAAAGAGKAVGKVAGGSQRLFEDETSAAAAGAGKAVGKVAGGSQRLFEEDAQSLTDWLAPTDWDAVRAAGYGDGGLVASFPSVRLFEDDASAAAAGAGKAVGKVAGGSQRLFLSEDEASAASSGLEESVSAARTKQTARLFEEDAQSLTDWLAPTDWDAVRAAGYGDGGLVASFPSVRLV